MNELNFIFVWLAGWLVLSTYIDFTVTEQVNGKMVRRWRKGAAFLVFLPIFFIACIGRPRADTWLYISAFEDLSVCWGDVFHKLKSAESGQGFVLFQFLIKKMFGNNITAFRVAIALTHSIPLVFVFRKYSENYLMTIFLFVTGCYHVGWMMNGLRQFMAATIIFGATSMLQNRRYGILIVVIVIASTFHITALLMLPIAFIVQGKAWNEKTVFYIVFSLVAMYVFDTYTGVLDFMLQGTEYEGTIGNWQAMGDDGTNPIRVFVNSIPMILAFLGRDHIRRENDLTLNVCVNMSVITTGLYLISMVTSGIMIGRLPVYTSLYNLVLLSNLIPQIFTKDSTKIVNILMIGLYICYYFVQI